MNEARINHYLNLERQVSSMVAQIESGGQGNNNNEVDTQNQRNGNYTAANSFLQTPSGGYLCIYPRCEVDEIFSSKTRFEEHQLQHFPEKVACSECGQDFDRTELYHKHYEQQHNEK